MKTYAEKLKDPRWQRRRLEKLGSVDFTCEACSRADKTLHVHHPRYIKGREPWEYEIAELEVLCVDCHTEHHIREKAVAEAFGAAKPLARELAGLVAGYLSGMTGLETGYVEELERGSAEGSYGLGLFAAIFMAADKRTTRRAAALLVYEGCRPPGITEQDWAELRAMYEDVRP